ncbi:tubulin-specific chaperone A [Tetranychus urticae]|uniref:Tubulin-specific chaperone A n=1 Tax=Tetranychus urticae TaxID=32264 RepID=T1JWJ8_TETUR|nr:tubulin-specific chaperone A [Tetranychus urticae]
MATTEGAIDPNDVRLKQLRIKTGVLKRLHKELLCYEKEATDETTKLDGLKSENAHPKEIEHQETILKETLNMIPGCKQRFEVAYEDLKSLVLESEELCDTELYKGAQGLLNTIRI